MSSPSLMDVRQAPRYVLLSIGVRANKVGLVDGPILLNTRVEVNTLDPLGEAKPFVVE